MRFLSSYWRRSGVLLCVVTGAFLAAAGAAAAEAPRYTAAVIPFVRPEVTERCGKIETANWPLFFNNRGDVVGWAPNDCEADFTTWIYTRGEIIDLGLKRPSTPTYPGGPTFVGFQSYPTGLNDLGQVVGWASSCFVQCRRAVLWDPSNDYNGFDLVGQSPYAAPNCLQNASPPYCIDDSRAGGVIGPHGEVFFSVPLLLALHNYSPFEVPLVYSNGAFHSAPNGPTFTPVNSGFRTTNIHSVTVIGDSLIFAGITYRLSDLTVGGLPASFAAIAINDRGQILGQIPGKPVVLMLLTPM